LRDNARGALTDSGTIRRFDTFPFGATCTSRKFTQLPPYTPGVERDSLYKDVWRRFWPELQNVYVSRFQSKYGPLTPRKIHEVERLPADGSQMDSCVMSARDAETFLWFHFHARAVCAFPVIERSYSPGH